MNVRLTPQGHPERTLLYGGVVGPIETDGVRLWLAFDDGQGRSVLMLWLATIAEIRLDDDGADP